MLLPATVVVVAIVAILDTASIKAVHVLVAFALIVFIAAIALFTAMVIALVAEVHDGNYASTGRLLRVVRPALGQLVLVGIVAGIAIGFLSSVASFFVLALLVGAALGIGAHIGSVIVGIVIGTILGIAPTLFLVTIWSVVAPVVVLERPGGLRALTQPGAGAGQRLVSIRGDRHSRALSWCRR